MPLFDHFAPPFDKLRSWRSFHTAWATNMAQRLNQGILPQYYYATPHTQLGAVEIDVAAIKKNGAPGGARAATGSGSGWEPPGPALTASINLTAIDEIEVRVLYDGDEQQVKAAVEIVSPSNKDRPSSRRAFAVKCADILGRGASLVIIDVVTNRRADLHADLLDVMVSEGGAEWLSPTRLSAVAYRMIPAGERGRLEVWPNALAVGDALPTLPLWLGEDSSVPLELEASYSLTCELLRLSA